MDYNTEIETGSTGRQTLPFALVLGGFLGLGCPGSTIAAQQDGKVLLIQESVANTSLDVTNPVHTQQDEAVATSVDVIVPATSHVADSIKLVRELCGFNITELANLFGKTRPTVYKWIKGGEVKPEVSIKLQVLEAVAKYWKTIQGENNLSFLFDYKGQEANDISIREAMTKEELSADALIALMDTRLHEYNEAAAISREIIGEVDLVEGREVPASTRKMNQMWTEAMSRIKKSNG